MAHFIRLSRFKPLVIVLASVVVAMLCVDRAIALVMGDPPRFYPPRLYIEISDWAGRIVGAQQMQQRGELPANDLVVMVGWSTAGADLDPRIVSASDPLHRQWLILSCGGMDVDELEVYCQPLFDSDLHARRVLIACHEFMFLGGKRLKTRQNLAGTVREFEQRKFSQGIRDGLRLPWLVRYHETDWWVEADAYDMQRRLLRHFKADPLARYAPDPDPFAPYQYEASEVVTQRGQIERSFSDPQAFSDQHRVEVFQRLIRRLRSRGAEVGVVLMPETAAVRRMTATLDDRFAQVVREASDGQPVDVTDLRGAMPDDRLFMDLMHLNPDGRNIFSREMPAHVP